MHLSSENVLDIESLLDKIDKKLMTHILTVFSEENGGPLILFNSVTSYFFVDKYVLEISRFIFDLFIISSSEFSKGDARLPKIETWRNWICTCVLSEFSDDLLKLKSANQIIFHVESSLIPSLQLSSLMHRLKDHFVKPFKDFYSVKGENLASLIKPKWTWDENIILLTEDLLIDKETRQNTKGIPEKEQYQVAHDVVETFRKTGTTPTVIKAEKESGVIDMLFRKSKIKGKQISILESADNTATQQSIDPAKELSKPENVPETKAGQAVDVDAGSRDGNTSTPEEKKRTKSKSKRLVRKDTKCDIGSVILESAQNIQKGLIFALFLQIVFGISDSSGSSGSRNLDIENIVTQLGITGSESFNGKISSVQTSLFQREMTISDIMQLPIAERELYFQKLEELKLDSLSAIAGKSR